ncbi:DUF1631 domain-containing protein, partial [Leclercia adecarboxylata]
VSAAFDPFSTGSFFTQLEALHVQTLQRFQQPQNDLDEIELNGDGAAQITADTAPTMVEVVDEIVLLAPGESREQEPEISLPDNDQALIQVDNLRVGSWVEFQEDEEHKLRCKLAAVIKPTGKYIFVN